MRIAVTGASGFIGGALAAELAAADHTVFSFGRRHADELQRDVPNYSRWDLRAAPIQVPDVDAVVHCAAQVGDWGEDADYRLVNVEGTRRVLEAFADARHFVHVSSASVYSDEQVGSCLTEDASVGDGLHSAYARTKFEAETAVLGSGRDAVILRPHIVYGPGDTTLMPRVLAARRFGALLVPGDGRNRISVTHISNLLHALQCVLGSSVTRGIFNIADNKDVSVNELLHTLLRGHGTNTRLLFVPRSVAWAAAGVGEWLCRVARSSRAPRLTRYLVAHIADERTLDLTRAINVLGYSPQYGYRDGLTVQENN